MKTPLLSMLFYRVLPAIVTGFALTAQAHEVWIEDTAAGELVIRFAEFGDDYEKSPGALDGLSVANAFAAGAEGKPALFETEKKSDHFLLVKASPKSSAQAECGFSVMGKAGDPEKPARRPIFYARWHAAGAGAAQPALTFDIVPTANAGEAKLYFRGKPVPQAKITAYLPDGSEKELVTNDGGVVRVDAAKPGLYLLAARHQREATPGFAAGRAFDLVSHNCSLAWRQP